MVFAFAGCGDDESTTSSTTATSTAESGTTGATGGATDIASITSPLEDAGYTVEEIPGKGDPKPESVLAVSGGGLAEGAFVDIEQYSSEDDAATAGKNYDTTGLPNSVEGTLVYFGTPPAAQADVDAVVSAAGS
jgi:hypothetical protein